MAIQIDYWSGELHQHHHGTEYFDNWNDACRSIEEAVENGFLCNVLHTDFRAPPERLEEAKQLLKDQL